MTDVLDGLRRNGRRALMALMLTTFAAATLAACNTVEGAGKDIEATGEAVQDAADDN